jgi:2-methylisocitrate lyase-like PEP mutase family enzyme
MEAPRRAVGSLYHLCSSVSQNEKAVRFRALHEGQGAFVIPNPWDVGSARILAGLGFQALATPSAASASALGRRDGDLTREEALAHARLIVNATDLPVSADLEKGFGDEPEVVAETIRLAAEAGLVGCTIEDATRNQDRPLYDFGLAVERIASAAQAAHALRFPFVLTARAHGLLYANPNLDETISRLQAFERAGADVLFAPGLPDLAAVRAVCAAVSKPVQFHGGNQRKVFSSERTRCGRSQAHQPRDLALSRSNDRFSGRCKRSKRQGRVQFPRPVRENAGAEQTHADLTLPWTRNTFRLPSVRMVGH